MLVVIKYNTATYSQQCFLLLYLRFHNEYSWNNIACENDKISLLLQFPPSLYILHILFFECFFRAFATFDLVFLHAKRLALGQILILQMDFAFRVCV